MFNTLEKEIIENLKLDIKFNIYESDATSHFRALNILHTIQKLTDFGFIIFEEPFIERSDNFFALLLKHRNHIYQRPMPWRKDN
ncbi:hypothetical protein ACQZ52_05770 [Agrobacterium rosae]